MILFTVFNPENRQVLSHGSVSAPEMVAYAVPHGCEVLVGRHVPFDQLAPEGFEIIIPALPETAPIELSSDPVELISK